MPLVTLDNLNLAFADIPILRGASMQLEAGERVCLIGRNGAGKSTLFKLISGTMEPDAGEIERAPNLRISQLHQALPEELDLSVHAFVAKGLAHLGGLLQTFEALSQQAESKQVLAELEDLQRRIEAEGGWNLDQRVDAVLSEMGLPRDHLLSQLSGGWRRRVGLAQALVSNPELLLLDEPTNHLDLATIEWLEQRIRGYAGTVLFITHDRAFLDRLATRIVELDRTRLTSWPGNYRNFLRRKQESLQAERSEQQEFDKKLAEEESWIRQGIKARRTRNEGRVRALMEMREEAEDRAQFKPERGAHIYIEESAEVSGRKVIELHRVSHGYGGHTLIRQLSLKIMRGERVGLIGNNGVGKSTLLNIMLGRLQPDSGTVKLGTNLEVGYFDQLRRELDPGRTVAETVGEGRQYITLGGKERHVVGYLRGFLFTAKRAMTQVGQLSGGECNRLILAKMFTRPTNLLVLDEPTNDLDVETLDVLEARLAEYTGTLIVVSHDRAFLDNTVNTVLVFEDDGQVVKYSGGYSDWLKRGHRLKQTDDPVAQREKAQRVQAHAERRAAAPKKLSYKLQRELDALPAQIEQLELEITRLQAQIEDPEFYQQAYEQVEPVLQQLAQRQDELQQAMERWEELEALG